MACLLLCESELGNSMMHGILEWGCLVGLNISWDVIVVIVTVIVKVRVQWLFLDFLTLLM